MTILKGFVNMYNIAHVANENKVTILVVQCCTCYKIKTELTYLK